MFSPMRLRDETGAKFLERHRFIEMSKSLNGTLVRSWHSIEDNLIDVSICQFLTHTSKLVLELPGSLEIFLN